jgi:AcrR family transcriptional regulator
MPFEELTVAAITARAGVGYATFFRHYSTREALLAEIADGLIGELLAVMSPLLQANDTGAAALTLARFVDARRPLCRALLVGAGEAMRRDITARAIALGSTAKTSMPEWLPPDLGVIHSVAATLTILRWWLEEESRGDAAGIAVIIDKLVFEPMVRPVDASADHNVG